MARAASHVVSDDIRAPMNVRQPLPEPFEAFVADFRHARGASADPIIGDADAGRMANDATAIQRRELSGDATNEVPDGAPGG